MVGERSCRFEAEPRGSVERQEVTLPALVARSQARTLAAESLRFPGEG